MKKILLIIVLLISLTSYSQVPCGNMMPTLTVTYVKPVKANQTIATLTACDEDFGEIIKWSLTSGTTNWKIVADASNSKKAYIQVKSSTAANAINKITTKSTVKAVAKDALSTSNICTIYLVPESTPAIITTFTFPIFKPVSSGQILGTINPSDVGFTAPITWKIISGNSANLWKIQPNGNNCDVMVNTTATAANNINKGTTGTYTIKITATDGSKLITYTVKLTVTPAK